MLYTIATYDHNTGKWGEHFGTPLERAKCFEVRNMLRKKLHKEALLEDGDVPPFSKEGKNVVKKLADDNTPEAKLAKE